MKRRTKIFLPLAAIALAGCQPVIELETDQLLAVDAPIGVAAAVSAGTSPEVSSGSDPAPGATSSAVSSGGAVADNGSGSTKAPAANPSGEPDWRARYAELSDIVRDKFKIPTRDRSIAIAMKDGRARNGFLLGVSGNRASFSIPIAGKEPANVTLERGALGPATRRLIWVDDAVDYHAKVQLKKEKAEYDRKNPKPVAAIPSANRPEQNVTQHTRPGNNGGNNGGNNTSRPGPGFIQPSTNALTANPDGSFDVVKNWLRANINNPGSIRVHTWGKLVRDPRPGVNGYNLDVVFSSDSGGSLGRIQQRKRFFLNRSGSITNTGNVRQ